MKNLKCTQCGASINADNLTCEYCGAVYLNDNIEDHSNLKNKKPKKIKLENITDNQLVDLIKKFCIKSPSIVVMIFFMLIWTSFAGSFASIIIKDISHVGKGFQMASIIKITSLIPLLFFFIGVSVIIKLIIEIWRSSLTKECNLIKIGKFEEAYSSLLKKENKKHHINYVIAMMLINCYRFNDIESARQMITNLPQKELAVIVRVIPGFLNFTRQIGVTTPVITYDN